MGSLKPGVRYVYERQDGIVYAREFGADASTRVEIGWDWEPDNNAARVSGTTRAQVLENQLWHDIRQTAKHHPALQAELERVKMLYYLVKDEDNQVMWHPV